VQSPLSLSLQTATSSGIVYGRLHENSVTEAAGAAAAVRAQLGYGSPAANPQYQAWTWINATYNAGFVDPANDEYQAAFTAPIAGSYRYAYRFSLDGGVSWTVCDQSTGDAGAGSNASLSFELADLPVMTVTP
jgi:hypothetical protein